MKLDDALVITAAWHSGAISFTSEQTKQYQKAKKVVAKYASTIMARRHRKTKEKDHGK